jgi:hypothetical protein
MSTSVWRRGAVSLTAIAVIAGIAGCQSGGTQDAADKSGADQGGASATPEVASQDTAANAISAAYKKTSAAKSAKVRMTMTVPATPGASDPADGGPMELSGVIGWNPTVADMTISGAALGEADPSIPDKIRTVMINNVMYMDMGTAMAKDTDGKRWMKLDLGAAAKASGDAAAAEALTGGLQNMDQDPSQQLGMLLNSPNLKHLGAEKVDGVQAEHYKGALTLDEMLKTSSALDVLGPEQRKTIIASMKKAGLKGYDYEVWVNKDDYPVQMNVGMDSAAGKTSISAHYSDYGAKAQVQAPPAGQTFDLVKMLGELGADAAAGSAAGGA